MRENIYARAEEKYVKTVLVYADDSNVLFYDEAKTEEVKTADAQDLFLKGLTVVADDVYMRAVAFGASGVICYDGTDAQTFTTTA